MPWGRRGGAWPRITRVGSLPAYSSVIVIDVMTSPGVLAVDGSRAAMEFTTSMPSMISPNTACALSRWGVGTNVMKNWLPFVLGPALAMERMPGLSCLRLGWNSSSNRYPGPATAGAGGVTALSHEPGYHAVEGHAVVVAVSGQEDEIVDRLGGFLREQPDLELRAVVHRERGGVALRWVYGHAGRGIVLLSHLLSFLWCRGWGWDLLRTVGTRRVSRLAEWQRRVQLQRLYHVLEQRGHVIRVLRRGGERHGDAFGAVDQQVLCSCDPGPYRHRGVVGP